MLPESSQALAIDVFGTLQSMESRHAVVQACLRSMSLEWPAEEWNLGAEYSLDRNLLGEPRPTQVDYLAESSAGLLLFECKFTESDGGACSQPQPLRYGAHRGMRQCNANYELQTNPITGEHYRCALTAKGVRYWEHVHSVLGIEPSFDYRPCPFSGGWYQWMRNLVAARALSIAKGVPSAFIVVFADGPFPMARKVRVAEWNELISRTTGREVPMAAMSYQSLLALALRVASSVDRAVLTELHDWVERKVRSVIQRRESHATSAATIDSKSSS